jgi:hypothetical protein
VRGVRVPDLVNPGLTVQVAILPHGRPLTTQKSPGPMTGAGAS